MEENYTKTIIQEIKPKVFELFEGLTYAEIEQILSEVGRDMGMRCFFK